MSEFQQTVRIAAPADAVYHALASTEGHTAMTGAPATVSHEVGGAWTAYGGAIHGLNVELTPGRRLVQVWRAKNWDEGVWSLVRFTFEPDGDGTTITMDHLAVPDGAAEHLKAGWEANYWAPLRAWAAERG